MTLRERLERGARLADWYGGKAAVSETLYGSECAALLAVVAAAEAVGEGAIALGVRPASLVGADKLAALRDALAGVGK